MDLHEYQTKKRFARFGIPVLPGEIAYAPENAYQIARKFDGPVMVKAQVPVSTRMKKGGILVARTPGEAHLAAHHILGATIQGLPVRIVLVEPAVEVATEIYLGITNDRAARRPVLVASAEGGVELEEIAHAHPNTIVRKHIDPLLGLLNYQAIAVANHINLPRRFWSSFSLIAQALYQCYVESDATLAEINPLIITPDNRMLAVDGKMSIDDNALYRHPDLAAMRDTDGETPAMRSAREIGVAYVKLSGQIGCLVNGAGLAMATMDVINLYGEGEISPANFLDIGGGASADTVAKALRIVLDDLDVRVVLINTFAGITRCDDVANGVVAVYREARPPFPTIVRLQGTNDDEGLALIREAGIPNLLFAQTLSDAARKAISAARELNL